MKADEPHPPVVKFGMATDESARMVERHFDLMDEGQLLAAGVHDHNLRTACIAKALLDGRPAPAAPIAPEPSVEPMNVAQPDLRASLGLS